MIRRFKCKQPEQRFISFSEKSRRNKKNTPVTISNKRFGFPGERYYRVSVDDDGNTYIAYHHIRDYERNGAPAPGLTTPLAGPEGHTDSAEDQYPSNHLRHRDALVQDHPGEHGRAYRFTQYNHRYQ